MKEIIYDKLVRDKIPEIIEAAGKKCEIKILNDTVYIEKIDSKLDEELAEYHADQSIDELADLLEVIYAAAEARGYTVAQIEEIRRSKAVKCGKFEHKILLKKVIED